MKVIECFFFLWSTRNFFERMKLTLEIWTFRFERFINYIWRNKISIETLNSSWTQLYTLLKKIVLMNSWIKFGRILDPKKKIWIGQSKNEVFLFVTPSFILAYFTFNAYNLINKPNIELYFLYTNFNVYFLDLDLPRMFHE